MHLKLLTVGIAALTGIAMAQTAREETTSPQSPDTGQTQTQTETRSTSRKSTSESRTQSTGDKIDTKSFRGMLVDANCGGASSGTSGSAGMSGSSSGKSGNTGSANRSTDSSTATDSSSQQSASSSTTDSTDTSSTGSSPATTAPGSSMNRTASQWQSCPATAGTTNFGLVTKDGQFMKFDEVGNSRAQQELKNHPKWTSGNKPANVKVRGVMSGDTVQVLEIK